MSLSGEESCRMCLETGGKSQKVKYNVYDIQVEQEVFLKLIKLKVWGRCEAWYQLTILGGQRLWTTVFNGILPNPQTRVEYR